ncbi:MAG: hypothetical protein HOQ22_08395 [Nocardioidaceae bacterium]|nr:hypothetical protein [Nocardioidaceae bacterium]NUS51039.1 hypothetical protein [Nocardioidaceae bacterium]
MDGRTLPEWELPGRQRQILEILAVNAGTPVSKDRLAELMWEGDLPGSYTGTLESYVCLLRRVLGLTGARRSALVTLDGGYCLGREVQVDVQEFDALVRESQTAGCADSVRLALQALDLVTGPMLASEPYAEWAERARERFVLALTAACEAAAGRANALRLYNDAVRLATSAVQADPLCEAAWQHLVRAHWLAGRRGEAMRTYERLRTTLAEELDEPPSSSSRELYLAVLRSGTDDHQAPADPGELQTLLRLLRQALETVPGLTVPARDAALSETAARLIAGHA